MENLNFRKVVEDRFYLENDAVISRIAGILNLMPSYAISKIETYEYTDVFYDTPENLLKNLEASIRLRTYQDKKILSIRCKAISTLDKAESNTREYEVEVPENTDFIQSQNFLLFLEDKLREIYSHRIEIDVLRKLRDLKPYLAIKTARQEYFIKNNREFTVSVCLDELTFQTRKNYSEDCCAKFKLTCYPNADNVKFYNNLLNDIKKRVLLIPMLESKFEAGIRTLNITSYKRPTEEDEEE